MPTRRCSSPRLQLLQLLLLRPVAYTKWWIPQQDQRIYAQVQEDVSGLIENSYTGAIYESVTSDQLKDISKDIRFIHSDSLSGQR